MFCKRDIHELPFHVCRFTWPVSSGLVILLKITLEWRINSQNIWRRIVCWMLINISPSNVFRKLFLLERYHLWPPAQYLSFHWLRPTQSVSSGPVTHLKITLEWRINSQNICRRIVCWMLINISPSNIFRKLFLPVTTCWICTLSCLDIYWTSVVWTCHTFEDNFWMNNKITKYLKENCRHIVLMQDTSLNIFRKLS